MANGLNNKYNMGYTTQAGVNFTPIVLTAASTQMQVVTGTAFGVSFTMPVGTTMPNGTQFTIVNLSNQSVTINSSGGNNIISLAANQNVTLYLVNNSVTTAAGWSIVAYPSTQLITSYASGDVAVTVTFGGGSPGTMAFSQCTYVKINALVFVDIYLAWSNKTGAGTGALLISGLPYQSVATYQAGLSIHSMNGVTFAGQVFPRVNGNATTATIAQLASGGSLTTWTDTNIGATTQIQMSGCYKTNS